MPLGKRKSGKIRTEHLPGPIATSYRRIFTRHEPDVDHLRFIIDTAEITARFLSAVLLCTLRELVEQRIIDHPVIEMGAPATRLKKPSFGLWMEILREGARRLHGNEDLFTDEAARSLAMQVCGYVFDEKQKSKGRPYSDLEALVVIRNKVHHPAEELDISALCDQSEDLINKALEQLAFFEDFPPYVVKQINLRRHRLAAAEYEHQCFLLQGEIDFPVAENDERTWHTETNEVLIYRGETSYLNLDPLFVFIHADDIDKSKIGSDKNAEEVYPGMYCFAGFASRSSGIVVDYLPCATSTKSFRTSNGSFRDDHLTGLLNQGVDELLQLLGETPSPEAAAG